MKQEIKTPLIVTVVAVVALVLGYFGYQSIARAGNLDQGQVNYTPGKPPWEETDPSKRGPGGPPGGGGVPGPAASTAPSTAQPQANVPPGLTAPTIDNSMK